MKFYLGLLLFTAFFVNSVNCFDGFKNKENREDFDTQKIFDRKLNQRHNRTSFEFESLEDLQDRQNNKIGFKFQKTGEGIEVNFNAVKMATQTEYVRMVFRKLVYNNVVTRLGDLQYNYMTCTQNNFSTCVIQSNNNLFGVQVDYNTQVFTKQFGNYTKKVYPTSVKITALLNTQSFNFNTNDNITLVVRFKSDNHKYFNHTERDVNELYSSGSYSYVNFEEYALDQDENTLLVVISTEPIETYDDDFEQDEHDHRRDDNESEEANRELHFVFSVNDQTNQIVWDPSIGVTETFTSSSSSSSSSNDNLKYLGFISLGVVFIVLAGIVIYRKRSRTITA